MKADPGFIRTAVCVIGAAPGRVEATEGSTPQSDGSSSRSRDRHPALRPEPRRQPHQVEKTSGDCEHFDNAGGVPAMHVSLAIWIATIALLVAAAPAHPGPGLPS